MHATTPARIAVIGGGAISLPVAMQLAATHDVWMLRRSALAVAAPLQARQLDVTRPETFDALPNNLDLVIYCLSPDASDDDAYRAVFVDGLQHCIDALKASSPALKRLLFVSSTSVYGQSDDSAVDEQSPCHPLGFSGRRLREGELRLAASGLPHTVLRFSGIYGPTRQRLLTLIRTGRAAESADYSNRIHEYDAIAALHFLAQRGLHGETMDDTYLCSDCEPVRMNTLIEWVRQRITVPASGHSSVGSERRAGSKRCINQRLRDTGFVFRYPSFREGYGEILWREDDRFI